MFLETQLFWLSLLLASLCCKETGGSIYSPGGSSSHDAESNSFLFIIFYNKCQIWSGSCFSCRFKSCRIPRNARLLDKSICLQPTLIFQHFCPFFSPLLPRLLSLPVPSSLSLLLSLSSSSSSSSLTSVPSLHLREEVTKLKFEAKTFHIYANQQEVWIMKTLPDSGSVI